jgi:hypothetical protein
MALAGDQIAVPVVVVITGLSVVSAILAGLAVSRPGAPAAAARPATRLSQLEG